MSPDYAKYIQDIIDSIKAIESYMEGVNSFSDYSKNYMLVDAVERRLVIIGEALWKAFKLNKNIFVTDQNKIIGLRHILVHTMT